MLTPREQEVVENLADGISNKVIARRMGITERTVKAHMTAIFEKTGTVNRMEVIIKHINGEL